MIVLFNLQFVAVKTFIANVYGIYLEYFCRAVIRISLMYIE